MRYILSTFTDDFLGITVLIKLTARHRVFRQIRLGPQDHVPNRKSWHPVLPTHKFNSETYKLEKRFEKSQGWKRNFHGMSARRERYIFFCLCKGTLWKPVVIFQCTENQKMQMTRHCASCWGGEYIRHPNTTQQQKTLISTKPKTCLRAHIKCLQDGHSTSPPFFPWRSKFINVRVCSRCKHFKSDCKLCKRRTVSLHETHVHLSW